MVLDHEERDAGRLDLADDAREVMQFGRIDAGGRLVEHEKLRPRRERAGDLEEPLLAVGKVLRAVVRALGDADEFQERHGLAPERRLLGDGRTGLQQIGEESASELQMKPDHDVVDD